MGDAGRRAWLLLLVLLGGHLALLAWLSGPAYAGPDAAGYLVPARLLATEGTLALRPESPAQFLGRHWLDAGRGFFLSRYPPGLPLLLGGAFAVGGPGAAALLQAVLAVGGVLLFFLLARRWVSPLLALGGTAVLAALPALNEQALLGFSHVATTTILLAGLLALDRARDSDARGPMLAAGFVFGLLPSIRSPAFVYLLVAAAVLALFARGRRQAQPLWFLVGAALPVACLFAYNLWAFGSPLRTAYSLTGEQTAFAPRHLLRNVPGYLGALARNAGPSLVLGALGMLALLARDRTRELAVLLLALTGSATLLYMTYYWPVTDIRFLLPTLPLYILAALCLLEDLSETAARRAILVLYFGVHGLIAVADGLPRVWQAARAVDRSGVVLDGARAVLPPGSVVIAPEGVAVLLEYAGRWKVADFALLDTRPPPLPSGIRRPEDGLRRGDASPLQAGRGGFLRAGYDGLDERARTDAVLSDLSRWAEGAEILWVVDPAWRARIDSLGAAVSLARVGRIPPPGQQPPPEPARAWWMAELPLDVYRVRWIDRARESGSRGAP